MDKGQSKCILPDQDANCIFSRLGGSGAISDMIDQFYYKVLFDKTLRGFFYNADMCRVRLQQKIYFGCIFGSKDQTYEGRELIELHRYMGVSNQHYDTFKKHLYTILQDMGHTQDLIQLVMEKIEEQRQFIVFETQQNTQQQE